MMKKSKSALGLERKSNPFFEDVPESFKFKSIC